MMEHVNRFKAVVTAVVGALTALWGWFGWFVVVWIGLMVLDYITGSLAAMKMGEWSSKVAREGIFHKGTEIIVIAIAGVLDFVIGLLLANLPAVSLPFEYSVLLCPLVVAWYVFTELGSILENSGKLGGPQPKWFKRAIAALKGGVDSAGEKLAGDEENLPPSNQT